MLTKLNENKNICEISLTVICTEQRVLPRRTNDVLNIVQRSEVFPVDGGSRKSLWNR